MSLVRVITQEAFQAECRAQAEQREEIVFICPVCKTLQTGREMMTARGNQHFDEVQGRIGNACIGRYTDTHGCTFKMGRRTSSNTQLLVKTPDGTEHPHFELASRAQADEHRAQWLGKQQWIGQDQ